MTETIVTWKHLCLLQIAKVSYMSHDMNLTAHFGCIDKFLSLGKWFTDDEIYQLETFGYTIPYDNPINCNVFAMIAAVWTVTDYTTDALPKFD